MITPQSEENRVLENNVHPSGWANPEPAGIYNLVVLGAGTAGLVSAAGAAGLGARVALVENHLFGGDCLNYGCVPSKGIIRAARAFHETHTAGQFGISGADTATIDFGKVMQRMQKIRAEISPHDSARRFRDELGIDVFFGTGRFEGPATIEVAGKALRFKRAAICTGARAAVPAIEGLAASGYLTNETVFSLTELPKRLGVIGGGPIGCELAQAFARLGSSVTLIQTASQLLGREDRDAADILLATFMKEGIDLRLGVTISRVELRGSDKVVVLNHNDGTDEVAVDQILVAAGRVPNIEGLALEAAGIGYDPKQGVTVNERLQTSNPNVYAAGDVCFHHKFTHSADALARILIANALFKGRQRTSSLAIPWCTYTDPEVAHVGMYEHEARTRGIAVTTITVPLTEVDRALLDGETTGFARVHLRTGSDKILGATIVARHAGEMINEITLAITNGIGLAAIGRTIHPYPTQAEVIKKLADTYNRSRLTPLVKRILTSWLNWQRR